MAKSIFEVEGLSDLVDGLLNELPKATATNVQKRALLKAAAPIEAAAKAAAPYRTGLLRERINISTKLSPAQKRALDKESKVEVYVGPPSMERAIVAEFGSVKQVPSPFMRPAWDSNKRSAFDSLKNDLAAEIEKARQRMARKAARQLAAIQKAGG